MTLRPKLIAEGTNEHGKPYRIIRMPFWASQAILQRAADNIRKDAAIEGRHVHITIGHRLIRAEGDLKS